MLKKLKNSKAFTMIELMVVIAILGIGFALIAGKFVEFKQKNNTPPAIEQPQPKNTESKQL